MGKYQKRNFCPKIPLNDVIFEQTKLQKLDWDIINMFQSQSVNIYAKRANASPHQPSMKKSPSGLGLKSVLRNSHFWGSRGLKTPKFSPLLLNWRSESCPDFISHPMPMKFGFSLENTFGQGQFKSILLNSYYGGSRGPKTSKCSPLLLNW